MKECMVGIVSMSDQEKRLRYIHVDSDLCEKISLLNLPTLLRREFLTRLTSEPKSHVSWVVSQSCMCIGPSQMLSW